MTNGNDSMYPTTGKEFINNSDHDITVGLYGGLTKREFFAALIMAQTIVKWGSGHEERCAKDAVVATDHLINELNKPTT